jgi:hypothetical protein
MHAMHRTARDSPGLRARTLLEAPLRRQQQTDPERNPHVGQVEDERVPGAEVQVEKVRDDAEPGAVDQVRPRTGRDEGEGEAFYGSRTYNPVRSSTPKMPNDTPLL